MSIIEREGVVDDAACAELRAIYDRHQAQARARDYSGGPVVYPTDVDAVAAAAIYDAAALVRSAIVQAIGADDQLIVETVVLAKLVAGGCHPEHVDCERLVDGEWVPNHSPDRRASALLYLSSGFAGGELVLPAQGVRIQPRAGLLVAFGSDRRYPHCVKPVTSGARYSLAVWCSTIDPAWRWP